MKQWLIGMEVVEHGNKGVLLAQQVVFCLTCINGAYETLSDNISSTTPG